ncbi:NADH-quinone oxidoreductase subunit J [Caldimonas thermodepolymerans]|jgi:NADH:ubiquinone oxidoreductase subunit 6 (chain J)|uniref:NADH-quinone oxidoreductase subunit J n=1 Tax=Caldimonas thermodepolymerans TaxID=215580 RepID=UPI00248FBD88|nr:NADH-quinone oxidoreductase subunit J [Caldimonas thermodepolymerans]
METTTALFYVFSAILLFAAFRVITARSTVHAALFLVLAFFNAACVWMLLKAEFLAISLVLVYVGAVMVLFLFVVMMLDFNTDALRQGFWKHFPLAGIIGLVIAVEMAVVLLGGFDVAEAPAPTPEQVELGNSKLLGIEMYTNYLYPLQIAAVILLVGIVSAIALTMRKRKDSRYVDPSRQVKVKKADRLRIVSMQPEVQRAAAPADNQTPTGGQA